MKAFPPATMSESVIRKLLKQCAYLNGLVDPLVRLPPALRRRDPLYDNTRKVCAYYSSLVSEQRLKDAGYQGRVFSL